MFRSAEVRCSAFASHPRERAQFREGSSEQRALRAKGQEYEIGLSRTVIPNPFDSTLTSRRCLLETGLAVSVAMPIACREGRISLSPPCNRPNNEQRFFPARHLPRQRRIRSLVGQIVLAGEEPNEWPPELRHVVTHRSAQHRVARLHGVEHGPLRHRPVDADGDLGSDLREHAQRRRQHDANHVSVWTSTDRTGGKSLTLGAQLSPASADPYTCPPLVPKYTPQGSSESMDIASRSTFT